MIAPAVSDVKSQEKSDSIRTEPPWWLTLIAALSLALNIFQIIRGGWISSPTSDASTYAAWLQEFFDSGIFGANKIDSATHGPVSSLLQHVVAVALGFETWGSIGWTVEANAGRHLAIAALGGLAVLAVGISVRVITNSSRWALVGAAFLGSVPMWVGHSMFNTTDVATATGFTLVTTASVILAVGRICSRAWLITAVSLLTLGLFLGLGSRPGLWIVYALTTVVTGIARYLTARDRFDYTASVASAARVMGLSFLAYATAYVLLRLLYPLGFSDLISLFRQSITSSSDFPWNPPVLTNGEVIAPSEYSWYQVLWFGNQIPVLTLLLLLSFFVMLALGPLFRTGNHHTVPGRATYLGSLPVLIQLGALPIAALVVGSTLYNGVRQLLFVIPAVAILATLGAYLLVQVTQTFGPAWRLGLCALFGLALLVPSLVGLRLFPYNYLYFNVLAELRGVDNRWSADYWRSSTRELVRMTPAGVPRDCDPWSGASLDQCADYPDYVLYANEAGKDAGPSEARPNQYYLMRYTEFGTTLPEMCRTVDTIERSLTFTKVTVGVLGICDFPLTEQVKTEFDFKVVSEDSRARLFFDNDAVLLWGWQVDPLLGVWANWDTAGLGFRLNASFRGRALELQLDGHLQTEDLTPRELHVIVNGREVGTALFGNDNRNSTQSFVVPIEVANRLDGDFVIELSDPSRPRGPLVYLLQAVRLTEQNGFGNFTP